MYSSEVQQPSQPIPTCNTPRCGPTSHPAVSEGVAPSPSDAGQVAPLLVNGSRSVLTRRRQGGLRSLRMYVTTVRLSGASSTST